MDSQKVQKRRYLLTGIISSIVIAIVLLAAFSAPISNDLSNITGRGSSSNFTYTTNSTIFTNTTLPVVPKAVTNPSQSCNLASGKTGIIVPIFSSYSQIQQQDVNEVIQAKHTYPSVPMMVVINPGGGPAAYNSNISTEINDLLATNLTVIGYVPTNWATNNISWVEEGILNFHNWYHVQGIYLDQMPNWEYDGPQGQHYYQGPDGTYIPRYFTTLTNYIESLGMTCVFGNSGADVPQNLLGTVSIIGIFENSFLPQFFGNAFLPEYNGSLTGINGWHMSVSKSNFAFFSYDISSYDPYYAVAASDYVGWLFLTNGTTPQPYQALPPYFLQMVSSVASMISINVSSEVLNGSQITNGGFEMIMTQPNGITSTGYTPFTFNVLTGSRVTLTAANFGGYVFSHWSDGNTSRVRNMTFNQSTKLTAYYTQKG